MAGAVWDANVHVVAAGSLTLVLPDVDIWVRAFSRHHPDPLVVHAFGVVVAERRVVLAGAVAQQVLARLRDDAAAARMETLLDAFPLVRAVAADHRRAAALMRLRPAAGAPHVGVPGAAAALLWAQAERVGGQVWSRELRWAGWAKVGCPVIG
jgi:hypothetical protein